MEKKKIISIEDRIPKLKEARKKKANRRLIFYLTLFFLLIAFVVYLQSPFSHIKDIVVLNNKALSDDTVIQASDISLNENIWMLNRKGTVKKIQNHPVIESVKVKRKLPNTVEINVVEKEIIGFLKEESKYHPVIKDGMIVKKSGIPYKGNYPLLKDFKDDAFLKHMAQELNELPNDLFNLISEITWNPTDKNKYKIELYMNDGFIVQSTMRDFADKMKSYPSIVSQLDEDDKGIIHMGVGTYFEKVD